MAVAIASGSDYNRTTGLPASGGAFTITVWIKWTTQVAWAVPWSLDAGTGDYIYVSRDDTASTFRVYDNNGAKGSTMTLSTGTWKFVAVSYNGSTFSFYSGNESGGALTAHNTGTSIQAVSPTSLRISESAWGGEDFVGSFAHFKMWNAALSQSEIETEKESISAVRTSNLNSAYAWTSGDQTTDDSGNGRTLSKTGSGFTYDSDNPILAAGDQTINLGRAVETDVARGLTAVNPRTVVLGRATETDVARGLTVVQSQIIELGRATESDTARGLTAVNPRTVLLGRTSEVDSARGLTVVQANVVSLGRAAEVDAARALAVVNPRTIVLGRATEANVARPLTVDAPGAGGTWLVGNVAW